VEAFLFEQKLEKKKTHFEGDKQRSGFVDTDGVAMILQRIHRIYRTQAAKAMIVCRKIHCFRQDDIFGATT
jgi:hypothetical protein